MSSTESWIFWIFLLLLPFSPASDLECERGNSAAIVVQYSSEVKSLLACLWSQLLLSS